MQRNVTISGAIQLVNAGEAVYARFMTAPAAVQLNDVRIRFGERTVLEKVDLTVAAGEHVCLRGPSGCGKTSLLRVIAGLARPASGQVSLFGTPVTPHSVWALRRNIAWVPQSPDPGDGTFSEWLDDLFSFQANRARRPDPHRREALMSRLQMPADLLQQPAAKLSGGELQRCALLAALLLRRPLLLLDEVSSALDAENKVLTAELLREGDRPAIISISHDPNWPGIGERTVSLGGKR